MILVDRVNGLLGPIERTRYELELEEGLTARELVDRYKDPAWEEPLAAIVNGGVVRGDELEEFAISDEDHVVVLPDPQGIGEILVFIAINILLPALISVGIAYAYAAIVGKPDKPQERGEGEESPTYSWDGIQTGYGAGYRIPIVYGIHRVGGQVIAANIFEQQSYEDVLGLYMVLSEGPISRIAGVDVETVPERNDLGGLFNPNPNPGLPITGLRVNGNEISDQRDLNASLRAGTLYQSPVPRWPDVTTVYDVNFELRAGIFNTYNCVSADVTSLRIRIRFAGLYKQSGNAAIQHTVVFGISFRKANLGWSAEYRVSASAARRSRFNWSTVVQFPSAGQWEVRIRRITPDDASDTLSQSTWTHAVESYGAGNGEQLRYPLLASMALMLRATERVQGNAPTVTLPIWGRTINWWTSAGGWQGETFFDSASSRWIGRNPSWILADFLTHSRYGLGKWLTVDDLVLENFEDAGDYSDVLVPDGKSGTHPRYHFDGVIDAGSPAWEYVLRICRAMQAIPVLVGKKLGLKFEHPDTPPDFPRTRNQVFAASNIRDVEQTWTDHRSRPNIIDAQILNEETDWQQDMVSVEDPEAFGLNEPWRLNAQTVRREGVDLFGVTRPAHARRLVYFMHATSRLWKSAIRFRCAVDALAVEVGDVIGVETEVVRFFDQGTQGVRLTRAISAAAVVYVDETLTTTGSSQQQLAIWKTDGTASVHPILAPTATQGPDSPWIIGGGPITCHKGQTVAFGYTDKVVKDFVVTAINLTEDMEREVEAILYDEDAFTIPAALELANDDPGTEQPFGAPLEETENVDLTIYEHGTRALVSFERPFDSRGTDARIYIRYYREKGAVELEDRLPGPWTPVWRGVGDEAEILGLEPGERYELAVVVEPRDGAWKGPDDVTPFEFVAVEFPTVSPLDPTHRWAAEREQGFELAWNDARHDSTRRYEIRQGVVWSGANVVARVSAERVWLERAPYNRGGANYQVRTVAESGLVSEAERPVLVTVGVPKCLSLTADREW